MNCFESGNRNEFSIEYVFFDEDRMTEISMYINAKNILSFTRNDKRMTTRWNLDELVEWLREFLDNMQETPYPVQVEGNCAAVKDINAREFDTDDDDEFENYYTLINDWVWSHTWHHASAGAILADVYFQLVGNQVEISWNNTNPEEGVQFDEILGCSFVPKDTFINVINRFLKDYAQHWFF